MNVLLSDIAHLRRKCPWYQTQTLETLGTYLAEEFQEVLVALENQDPIALKEELGDLLFQILVYSELASEVGWFTMPEVIDDLHRKIMRRNQHVFGNLVLSDIEAVNLNWQAIKAIERNLDREGINWKMYEVTIEQDQAFITFKNHPTVAIPLEPPTAQNFAPGYTYAAWVWLALNDAFEHATVSMPEDAVRRLAIQISKQVKACTKREQGSELPADCHSHSNVELDVRSI